MTDGGAPGPAGEPARWQAMDMGGLIARLEEAKALLDQACAVAAAQDGGRIPPLVELHRRLTEDPRADDNRRRYR
jgi:hypothetical protein